MALLTMLFVSSANAQNTNYEQEKNEKEIYYEKIENPNFDYSTKGDSKQTPHLTLGGDNILNSLKIEIVGPNIQVYRNVNTSPETWEYQWYISIDKPAHTAALYIDGTEYEGGSDVSTDYYVNGVGPAVNTDDGYYYMSNEYDRVDINSSDSYSATIINTITGTLTTTINISYLKGSDYIVYDFELENISGGTLNDVRFFFGGDTYSYGSDYGDGFKDGDVIGCTKNNGETFYFEAFDTPTYYDCIDYIDCRDNISNAPNRLSNTVTTSNHDNAVAFEWDYTMLAGATETVTIAEKYSDKQILGLEVTAPTGETIEPGQTKNITFEVENVSGSLISDIDLTELIDLAGWTVSVTNPLAVFDLASGATQSVTIEVTCPGTATVGDIAKVTLTATDDSGAGSNTGDDNAFIEVIGAGAISISGTLTYDNVAANPLQSQTVKLMQGVTQIDITTTNASGVYTFEDVADGDYVVTPVITLDWKGVTAMDATIYEKHVIASPLLTGLRLESGDMKNNDNTITALDITEQKKRIVADPSASFDSGDWANTDGSVTIAGSSQTVDIQAICYGDANASYPFAKYGLMPISVINQNNIYLNDEEYFEIPVKTAITMNDLSSITLNIMFDENLINISEIEMTENNSQMLYSIQDGIVRIVLSTLNSHSFAENDILFYIKGYAANLTEQVNFSDDIIGEFANYDGDIFDDVTLIIPQLISNNTNDIQFNQNDIVIFPNPAKNFINITNISNSKIEIYDIYGSLIKTENIKTNSTKLDTQNFPNGTYFIKILKNDKVTNHKFTIVK